MTDKKITAYDYLRNEIAGPYGIDIDSPTLFSNNKRQLLKLSLFVSVNKIDKRDEDDYHVREHYEIIFERDYRYELHLTITSDGTPGCCESFGLSDKWYRTQTVSHDSDPEISLDNASESDSDS